MHIFPLEYNTLSARKSANYQIVDHDVSSLNPLSHRDRRYPVRDIPSSFQLKSITDKRKKLRMQQAIKPPDVLESYLITTAATDPASARIAARLTTSEGRRRADMSEKLREWDKMWDGARKRWEWGWVETQVQGDGKLVVDFGLEKSPILANASVLDIQNLIS
jgi:hypothetical protein